MLSRLTENFNNYDFDDIARDLYEFTWDYFCDWYVEIAKIQLKENPDGQTKRVLHTIFEGLMRALHPIMPFITEELWESIAQVDSVRGLDLDNVCSLSATGRALF